MQRGPPVPSLALGHNPLAQIEPGVAIKVPLAELKDSQEKVRSALNHPSRKSGRTVATASDDTFLYLWNEKS